MQIMSYDMKLQDVSVLKIILEFQMMLMILVGFVNKKYFKKYQKICYCNVEIILFIGILFYIDYIYFMY